MVDDLTRAFYEERPFPPRLPDAAADAALVRSPSDLDELSHYLFQGGLPAARPFRVLVAGGGTGDAVVMLGRQLAARGIAYEIVYVDQAVAPLEVARARCERLGLTGVRFVRSRISAMRDHALGAFHYVDCSGVLHHMRDPGAGLEALARHLHPEGGLGLMLYGRRGRVGLDDACTVLEALTPPGLAGAAQVEAARAVLRALPDSTWLKRNPVLMAAVDGPAEFFADIFLNPQRLHYTVTEIDAMLGDAGLTLAAFLPPSQYDPRSWVPAGSALADRLAGLDYLTACAVAEALAGRHTSHVCYATVGRPRAEAVAAPHDETLVPIWHQTDGRIFARALAAAPELRLPFGAGHVVLPGGPICAAIVRAVDGRRPIAAIVAGAAQETDAAVAEVRSAFARLYRVLHGAGWLLLRTPGAVPS